MCGIFGITNTPQAAGTIKLGLYELQHRGQESCGACCSDGNQLTRVTRMGLVMQQLDETALSLVFGSMGIGHTRYSTAGSSCIENAQPFRVECKFGSVAIAHNGNLTNATQLRKQLQDKGATFKSSSDTEVLLQLIAFSKQKTLLDAIKQAISEVEGAYSLLFLTPTMLIAIKDPYGFRPLAIGRLPNGGYVFASETSAFRHCEAEYVCEVNPGEMVVVKEGQLSRQTALPSRSQSCCVFEAAYLGKPDSLLFGRSVYETRLLSGQLLAKLDQGLQADVVVGVPDSGVVAAQGYAEAMRLPYRNGLIRSHYSGRTFIDPAQESRQNKVALKLAPVIPILQDKRVVLVDDSLVRGSTSKKVAAMVRKAGAREVHMRIATPRVKHCCFYGIDTPTEAELIANKMSLEEIAREIGADSLKYLPLEQLLQAAGGKEKGFCHACFSGEYPSPLVQIR